MKKMRTWLIAAGICLILSGCGAAATNINGIGSASDKAGQVLETTYGAVTEELVEETKEVIWTKEQKSEIIGFLEDHFGNGLDFENMEPGEAASYGQAIEEYYDLTGRVTEDGYGYVIAFKKGTKDPFEGYDQYWQDGEYVVVKRNDQTGDETPMFSLPNIDNIYHGENNDILYFQLKGFEEPEEIGLAFIHKFCRGEEGEHYILSVIERKVKLTAPDSGAYLEVNLFDDGQKRLEYVPLTREEEERIAVSDALILPEWYGNYGLQFFVSEESYEKTGNEQGPITYEALKIAEERCEFSAMNISEINNITEANFKMEVWDEENGDHAIEIRITDDEVLKELENIFANAEVFHEGKCPYTGILTLIREDGMELTLSLATDSCDGFVFGSHSIYTVGKENTERVWEILSEARPYTGWEITK